MFKAIVKKTLPILTIPEPLKSTQKILMKTLSGGRSPRDTANNYKQILQKLQTANIKISAAKTKVFLKSIDVLGWKWNQGGFLSPSPHRVNALKNTKPDDIKTIKDMRSWMGLYKTLL